MYNDHKFYVFIQSLHYITQATIIHLNQSKYLVLYQALAASLTLGGGGGGGGGCSPDSTSGTNTAAMHNESNPTVLQLWTQKHCLS